MNHRIIIAGVVGAALVGGGVFWAVGHPSQPPVTYTTTPADRGELTAKVSATGTVSALVQVEVGSQASGRVADVLVDYNSPVRKGQVLARLDPSLQQASLAQAQANDASAESNLTRARVEARRTRQQLERTRQMFARQLIARADLDAAQADFDAASAQVAAAEASVAQARAQVNTAQTNLKYVTIVSPVDGIVISRSVDPGQTVAASLQAPTLFVIAQDLHKAQVKASVSEADVGKLKPGMPATFTVAAFPNEQFEGKVRQVRNAATVTQNVVTYDALIDVNNPKLELRPGMTANVTFVWADREDALRVPNAALRFTPTFDRASRPGGTNGQARQNGQGGSADEAAPRRERLGSDPTRRRVWILKDGKPERVRVRVGISDGSFTEITGGELKEGDQVITDASNAGSGSGGNNRSGNRRNRPPRF